MVEPVLLTDEILDVARQWRDECLRRWREEGAYPLIGEATLTSPVNGSKRKVRLHLAVGSSVKGKTFAKILSEAGEAIGEGYTIVLNRGLINPQIENLMPILLHELTHALDPEFDKDIVKQEQEQEKFATAQSQYNLPSEQRAFAAMWTDELREDIKAGRYRNPGVAITFYKQRSVEFDGFYGHGQIARHHLLDQLTAHIRAIAEELKQREAGRRE